MQYVWKWKSIKKLHFIFLLQWLWNVIQVWQNASMWFSCKCRICYSVGNYSVNWLLGIFLWNHISYCYMVFTINFCCQFFRSKPNDENPDHPKVVNRWQLQGYWKGIWYYLGMPKNAWPLLTPLVLHSSTMTIFRFVCIGCKDIQG